MATQIVMDRTGDTRHNFEICSSITELVIDFIAQDGRAENLRATLIVAMATSPAFARKGSRHHSKARLSTGRPGPIGMTFHANPTTSRSTEISGALAVVSSRGPRLTSGASAR